MKKICNFLLFLPFCDVDTRYRKIIFRVRNWFGYGLWPLHELVNQSDDTHTHTHSHMHEAKVRWNIPTGIQSQLSKSGIKQTKSCMAKRRMRTKERVRKILNFTFSVGDRKWCLLKNIFEHLLGRNSRRRRRPKFGHPGFILELFKTWDHVNKTKIKNPPRPW